MASRSSICLQDLTSVMGFTILQVNLNLESEASFPKCKNSSSLIVFKKTSVLKKNLLFLAKRHYHRIFRTVLGDTAIANNESRSLLREMFPNTHPSIL